MATAKKRIQSLKNVPTEALLLELSQRGYTSRKQCEKCRGIGILENTAYDTCPDCRGSGYDED